MVSISGLLYMVEDVFGNKEMGDMRLWSKFGVCFFPFMLDMEFEIVYASFTGVTVCSACHSGVFGRLLLNG